MARFNISTGSGTGSSKKGGCGGAVMGVFIGLIMIPVGFYLAYYGEAKLVDHSRIFDGIEMVQPDAAMAMDGELVKFSGQPEAEFLTIEEWQGQALYWESNIEEYVREEDAEGEVSYRWKSGARSRNWVPSFTVAPVTVRPGGANPVGSQEVYSAYRRGFETGFHVRSAPASPEVGDQRKTIDVLDGTRQVIVLGQMSNGTVEGGRSFVVSVLNEQETFDALRSQYLAAYWGIKAGAVFLIFFGIMAVFGPLTSLVGYIPMVGDGLSCAFSAFAFAFAVVSVTVITVFMKAFWFLVVIALLGVGFLIFRGVTTPRTRPGAEESLPPPPGAAMAPPTQPGADSGTPASDSSAQGPINTVPRPTEPGEQAPSQAEDSESEETQLRPDEPVAGPKFCASCGGKLDSGSKFCGSCGSKV